MVRGPSRFPRFFPPGRFYSFRETHLLGVDWLGTTVKVLLDLVEELLYRIQPW